MNVPAPPGSIRRGWLIAGFVIAFCACAAMLWPLSYSDVEIPGSLKGLGLFVIAAAAVLARLKGRAGFLVTTAVVGLGVPAAIAARVAVETAMDPTSHNLWPFELVLGGMVGHAGAAAGALAAGVWWRISGKE